MYLNYLVATTLNPYQGLKRVLYYFMAVQTKCCNDIKSLSGIETSPEQAQARWGVRVATTLNPYQGLKRLRSIQRRRSRLVATTLNPYQGLKQLPDNQRISTT